MHGSFLIKCVLILSLFLFRMQCQQTEMLFFEIAESLYTCSHCVHSLGLRVMSELLKLFYDTTVFSIFEVFLII